MTDENYTFTQARTRLEEIVTQVRSKDVSLEKSLDLLEEGVRLANICTEQSDHTEWRSVVSDEDSVDDVTVEAEDSGVETDSADEAETESDESLESDEGADEIQDTVQGESSEEAEPSDEGENSAGEESDDDSEAANESDEAPHQGS